jgi:uncharacterized protein with PQ loop repeat
MSTFFSRREAIFLKNFLKFMELITNLLGLTYTSCFALCFIPQMVKTIISKDVDNVSVSVYYICLLGYVSALTYTVLKVGLDFWLQINFIVSGITSAIMIYIYHKYKNREVVVNKVVRNIRVD